MFEKLMKNIDYVAIIVGGVALILSLFGFNCNYLIWLAGVLCLMYIAYAAYLWALRPKFDWHLINGHFLRKVVAFVLLVPSLITSVYLLYNIGAKFDYSPKNLIYDDNLYIGDNSNSQILEQRDPPVFWTVYYHFIDPGNQHITKSLSGRVGSALIAILGVFLLNGLLVSSIIGWIDSRKSRWLCGEIKYPSFLRRKKHYVIIGGNDVAFGVVKRILENSTSSKKTPLNRPYILIQTSDNVENLRRELFSTITEEQQKQIIFYYGNRTSIKDVEDLCIENTEEIYILGEKTRTDKLEPYHDTVNMRCFNLVLQVANDCHSIKNNIKCYVMFEYQTSFAAFQSSHQNRIIPIGTKEKEISFIPFSPYESWAQTILVKRKIEISNKDVVTYSTIDGDGISFDSEKTVHLIIVGMSKMGTAMAIETAHLAHFPNFVKDSSKRTKITFIDKNARDESCFFMGRFPDIFKLCKWTDVDGNVHNEFAPECDEYKYFGKNFLDIEWEFRAGGVELKENREYIERCLSEERNEIVTIAICLPWPHQSLAAALYLPQKTLLNANDIWVYQPQSGEFLLNINNVGVAPDNNFWNQTTYKKLKPFGMFSQGFDATLLENEAIKYCNNFYQVKDVLVSKYEKDGNDGKKCYWDSWKIEDVKNIALSVTNLPLGNLWATWSNIYQINTIDYKYRSLGTDFFALNNSDIKVLFAEVEHNRWNMEKLLMGYKPMRNHILNEEETEAVKDYLIKEKGYNPADGELETIQAGVNENEIYYNWEKQCFNIQKVKNFYKDGPMKIHPNICPFEYLPVEDKDYDICFSLAMPFLKEKSK